MKGGNVKKLKLYLDNCCFNRPYDEIIDQIMSLEIESKLYVQDQIKNGYIDLVWSFILDYENDKNPYNDIRDSILLWKNIAVEYISPDNSIREYANKLVEKYRFGGKDALHICCAIKAGCNYLLTTDKKMIKKAAMLKDISIVNPIHFVSIMEDQNAE